MDAPVRVLAEVDEINLLLLGLEQQDRLCVENIASDLAQHLVLAQDIDDLPSHCASQHFSALLIDITAFDIDAMRVIEKIRQHHILQEIPLLIFTHASGVSLPSPPSAQAQLVYVMSKPVAPDLLRDQLAILWRLARQTMSLKQQANRIASLETQLQVATAKLARSTVQWRNVTEEMNQFTYIASHDLREPLRMVSSFMNLLNDRYQLELDEQAKQFIFYAVDGAARMQNLINGIVEFNHIRRSTNTIEFMSVNWIVDAVLEKLSAALAESHAEVTRDEFPRVYADREQLMQVFACLLDNAIKFRSERPLAVHLGVRKDGQFWIFSVRDNGIGFDESQSKRIFGLFQTLHEREKYPGCGTGLAIAKKIIESYGGEMWVAAVSNQGAKFEFKWPIDEIVDWD